MNPEAHRWGLIRLALECPHCEGQVRPRVPTLEARCDHCGERVPIEESVYTGLAIELATHLDALPAGTTQVAIGVGGESLEVVFGRQAPLCWQCGDPLPLSAADIGRRQPVECRGCGARSHTFPPPPWLKAQVPDALQIYAAVDAHQTAAPRLEIAGEPVWVRCPACEVGQRIDGGTERITRCPACHALHHVPDVVWASLHPVRHQSPWFILFEQMGAKSRAEMRQRLARARAARAAIGEALPPEEIDAHLEALAVLPEQTVEDLLFEALSAEVWPWFTKSAAALRGRGTARALARLGEALHAASDPRRALHLAELLSEIDGPAVAEVCARLADHPEWLIAVEAMALWARHDVEAALPVLRAQAREGGLERAAAITALRLTIDPTLLGVPDGFRDLLLDHPEAPARRAATRLFEATTARNAERLLQVLLSVGEDREGLSALVGATVAHLPGAHIGQGLLEAARRSSGVTRLRGAMAVSEARLHRFGEGMADLLHHRDGAVAEAAAEALLAEDAEHAGRALCRLLQSASLEVRIRAADALAEVGTLSSVEALKAVSDGWFVNRELRRRAEAATDRIRWRHRERGAGGLSVADEDHLTGGLSEE